jgi:hypothetical protein
MGRASNLFGAAEGNPGEVAMGLKGSGSDADRTEVARQAIEGLERIRRGPDQHTPVAVSRSIESPAAAAGVAAYIDRNFPTKGLFAQRAKIDAKTLSRLLNKPHRVSKTTWAVVAAAMGIKLAELLRTGH